MKTCCFIRETTDVWSWHPKQGLYWEKKHCFPCTKGSNSALASLGKEWLELLRVWVVFLSLHTACPTKQKNYWLKTTDFIKVGSWLKTTDFIKKWSGPGRSSSPDYSSWLPILPSGQFRITSRVLVIHNTKYSHEMEVMWVSWYITFFFLLDLEVWHKKPLKCH